MSRRILAALTVLAVGVAAPGEARKTPPKQQSAKRGEAQRRALVRRHAAAVRRREAARRKALAAAQAAVPDIITPAPPAAPAVPSPVVSEPPAPPPVLGRAVGITAYDTPLFYLRLSRTEVAAGTVTIQMQNAGEDAHDLRIETLAGALLQAWDEIASGDPPAVKDVVMTAGVYRVYCSLPGHAAAGMDTQLTVAG